MMANTSYLAALNGVANNTKLSGWSYYASKVIYCFVQQRLAASALIGASWYFLKESTVTVTSTTVPESRSYFMWLLSCLKSMIKFDSYSGNKAGYSVIFGDERNEGLLMKLIRFNPHDYSKFVFTYKRLRSQAKLHINEMERNLQSIAKKVGAHDNGINFALKIKASDDAKARFLWPIDSNYNQGTEYSMFQQFNGGVFPTTQKAWIKLIEHNVIPEFLGYSGDEEEVDGQKYYGYSIDAIKKMMK